MSYSNSEKWINEFIKNTNKKLFKQFLINDMKDELKRNLLECLIKNEKIGLLKIVFNNYFYNNSILSLLLIYKNKEKISTIELKKIVDEIKINDGLYSLALKNDASEVIKILFMNDLSESYKIEYRISRYKILNHAIILKDIDFIKKVLSFHPFNFKDFDSDIFIKNADDEIIKIFINSSFNKIDFYNDYKRKSNHQYLNFILNKLIINSGKLDIIKYFFQEIPLKFDVNLNIYDINNQFPIVTALYHDKYEIFEFLLSMGADPKIENNSTSLLSIAIDQNHSENFVMLLLKYNIDINKKDINDQYPLMKAISLNKLNIVKLLMNHSKANNIKMDILDIKGYTPMVLAYKLGNYDILKFLLDNQYNGININQKDLQGNSLLYHAMKNSEDDFLIYLINHGININQRDYNGNTLLHYALENSKDNILNYLINEGADFNQKNNNGNTILYYALEKNKDDLVQYLIVNGADIDYYYNDNNKYNIIDYAICKGEKYLRMILDNRNNISLGYCDHFGNTPLMRAIFNNFSNETIIDLVKKGSNVNDLNNSGDNALARAIRNQNLPIAKYLICSGSKIHTHSNNLYDIRSCFNNFIYGKFEGEDYEFLKKIILD